MPRSSPPGVRQGRRSRSQASTLPATPSITPPPWVRGPGFSRGSRRGRAQRRVEAVPQRRGRRGRERRARCAAARGVRAHSRLLRRRHAALVSLQPATGRELDRAERALGRAGLSRRERLRRAGPLPQPLDAQEGADMLRRSRGFGKPDAAIMQGGYFLVDMTLARPEADAESTPIARLRGRYG